MSSSSRVAKYYEHNTRRFLRFGAGTANGAIHRGIWLPGVRTAADATDGIHRLLMHRLQSRLGPESHLLDLGCGVGVTMTRLAVALNTQVTGVTLSALQARLAQQRFQENHLEKQCRVICGDFAALPEAPRYDAMVAIEAVAHADQHAALFAHWAARLKPGGLLLLCDDWLTLQDRDSPDKERCVAQFRRGWRLGPLQTLAEVQASCAAAGLRLIEHQDLTPYLRLQRPRDRLLEGLRWGAELLPRLGHTVGGMPWVGSLIGGAALCRALHHGWLSYGLLVFEKADLPPSNHLE